jgi:hypothetical protein
MADVMDFVTQVGDGKMADAEKSFANIMQDKINSAMNDRKIELANNMAGVETETEEVEDHDEIQGVSDESE